MTFTSDWQGLSIERDPDLSNQRQMACEVHKLGS